MVQNIMYILNKNYSFIILDRIKTKTMKMNKTTTGKILEDEACLYLTNNGYNIIERNFRLSLEK